MSVALFTHGIWAHETGQLRSEGIELRESKELIGQKWIVSSEIGDISVGIIKSGEITLDGLLLRIVYVANLAVIS